MSTGCNRSDGSCPLRIAMNQITGGGYANVEKRYTIKGGAPENDAREVVPRNTTSHNNTTSNTDVTYTVSEAAFHASLAKLQLARDQMKSREYRGSLLQLSGQPRILGICYLLSNRNILLRDVLNSLQTDNNATIDVDACCVYPNVLYSEVKRVMKNIAGRTVEKVPTPDVKLDNMGNFAIVSPNNTDWDTLHLIADDLLEISKLCADIELYHLKIVSFIYTTLRS